MSNKTSLKSLFGALQMEMTANAEFSNVINHPTDKGDNTENSWIKWFNRYLPNRYMAKKAHAIDALGNISEQIDIIVFDAQYSYLAFNQNDILYVPAESIYAVFEVKPTLNKDYMEYAGKKAASVRRLHRTSAPIPYAGGKYPPKTPHRILSGVLTTNCEWVGGFGTSFKNCLERYTTEQQIDCGCVLNEGAFFFNYESMVLNTSPKEEGLVFFFLQLLIILQGMGTVPAIDLNEYMRALSIKEEKL